MYKLILCQTEPGWEEGDQDTLEVTSGLTVSELADHATEREWELKEDLYRFFARLLDKSDGRVLQELKQRGWANIAEMKDEDEKLVATKQYFVAQQIGSGYQLYPFDPKHPHSGCLSSLAIGAELVQVISKPSMKKVLPKDALKQYNEDTDRVNKDLEKRRAAAVKRKALKKKRELAKARKVLEDAGELKAK